MLQVFERPVALNTRLVAVIGTVSRVKARNDRKKLCVFWLERRYQRGRASIFGAGNDLPLVDQVGVAAQRRGAPGIAFHTQTGVRQGLGAHANFYARSQAGLTAVNAGHAMLCQPLAPGAVGQNHGFSHDQVQRCAALAGGNADLLMALWLLSTWVVELEVIVRAVEVFGFAASHFTQ